MTPTIKNGELWNATRIDTSAPAAARSATAGRKYYYDVRDGQNVRMPILSFDPLLIDRAAAEPYDQPPLTGDVINIRKWRNKRRIDEIEAIADDPRTAFRKHTRRGLIDDVMKTYGVSRVNARAMICKARKLKRA